MKKTSRRTKKTSLGPTTIQEKLCEMFPAKWLKAQARKTNLIVRERKVKAEALFWVLVLSYGVAMQRSLASLKRGYEKETGQTLSDGSWYDRFTPELVEFLKVCVEHGIATLSAENRRELSERLKQFEDVLIKDSTIIRLHEKLAQRVKYDLIGLVHPTDGVWVDLYLLRTGAGEVREGRLEKIEKT